MQKEWSSYRITLSLYILVLILPLSFYFVYSSFKTIQNDTEIVYQTAGITGTLEYLALNPSDLNQQRIITNNDKSLQTISSWVGKNDASDLYIGAESLSKDFAQIESCWNDYKQILSQQDTVSTKDHALKCGARSTSFAIVVEKMVYLKQKKMINLFYASLTVAMILILLIIYFVRVYIHTQMKKHAIHDHDSRLFNKKYFMSELKVTSSRSARHDFPLSLLRISIDELEEGNNKYSKSDKKNTLLVFGNLVRSLVRDGDIPSRYDDNHFLILLPFTDHENTQIFKERVEDALRKDPWMKSKEITFDFSSSEFDKKESEEAFILRTLA